MTEHDNRVGKAEIRVGHTENSSGKPKQDYSDLPQKPIKLKEGIGGLAGPRVDSDEKVENHISANPRLKSNKPRVSKQPGNTATRWTLQGVSAAARKAATEAAKREGLPLGEWLEKAIFTVITPAAKTQNPQQPQLDALTDIQVRLERLEHRAGWLSRLKHSLKTWFG